jgi:hypothetical protein
MAMQTLAELEAERVELKRVAIKAFVDASKKIKSPTKNATNPFLKNKYADLGSVIDSVK